MAARRPPSLFLKHKIKIKKEMANEKRYVVYAEHGNYMDLFYYHTESEARDKLSDLLATKSPDWEIWMDKMSDEALARQKRLLGLR